MSTQQVRRLESAVRAARKLWAAYDNLSDSERDIIDYYIRLPLWWEMWHRLNAAEAA